MQILSDNRLIAWGTVAGSLLAAVTLIGGGIVYTVKLRDDASASRVVDADHEVRIRVNESGLAEMKADVREIKTDVTWIRKFLDRQPAGPGDKEPTKTASN